MTLFDLPLMLLVAFPIVGFTLTEIQELRASRRGFLKAVQS